MLVLAALSMGRIGAAQDWLPLKSAIVLVRTPPQTIQYQGRPAKTMGFGTGTLIAIDPDGTGGYVLTAKHVVDGAKTMTAIWKSGFGSSGPVVGSGHLYDTCIFRVAVPPGAVAMPVSDESPNPGETVDIAGYPYATYFEWSRGTVRSYTYPHPDQMMEINAPATEGMSGGPIIYKGCVVGTIVAGDSPGTSSRYTYGTHHQPIRNLLREIMPHGLIAGIDARRQLAQSRQVGACPPGYG
jgi:S1-C subfamily serine protease